MANSSVLYEQDWLRERGDVLRPGAGRELMPWDTVPYPAAPEVTRGAGGPFLRPSLDRHSRLPCTA